MFAEFDTDDSGQLDWGEFKGAMKKLGIRVPVSKMRQLFAMFDEDETGEVDYFEFCRLLYPNMDTEIVAPTSMDTGGGGECGEDAVDDGTDEGASKGNGAALAAMLAGGIPPPAKRGQNAGGIPPPTKRLAGAQLKLKSIAAMSAGGTLGAGVLSDSVGPSGQMAAPQAASALAALMGSRLVSTPTPGGPPAVAPPPAESDTVAPAPAPAS